MGIFFGSITSAESLPFCELPPYGPMQSDATEYVRASLDPHVSRLLQQPREFCHRDESPQ
jgi:hypothetical protein